jgi:hypothetical protein
VTFDPLFDTRPTGATTVARDYDNDTQFCHFFSITNGFFNIVLLNTFIQLSQLFSFFLSLPCIHSSHRWACDGYLHTK